MIKLLALVVTFLVALPLCTAYLCILGCEANCSDGASYCDDPSTCMNDGLGGCYSPDDYVTVAIYDYYNLVTSTVYTSTEQQYSTETYYDYVTEYTGEEYYETSMIFATSTETETASPSTVTAGAKKARAVPILARQASSVVTTQSVDCNVYDSPYCTTTQEAVWTEIVPYATTVASTVTGTSQDYYTTYYTSYVYTTYTYTPDPVTVAADDPIYETPTPSPEAEESPSPPEKTPTPPSDPDIDPIISNTPPAGQPSPAPAPGGGGGGPITSGSPTSGFVTVIVPTAHPGNAHDSSALAALQKAVPTTAQSDAAGACFLFSQYTSAHATPTWYTGLATDVQSYFSSANAQNTAACVPSPVADKSVGLSSGAKGGIAGGVIAGAALLAGLAYLMYTKFIAPKAMAAKSAPAQSHSDNSGKSWQDNGGQQWQHQDNSGQPWQNNTGQPDIPSQSVNANTGGPEMSQPSGWSGVTGDPASGGWNGVIGPSSPPAGTAPPPSDGHIDELFFIAGGGRRRRSQEEQRPPPPGHTYSNQSSMYMPSVPGQYSIPGRAMPPREYSDQPEMSPFADSRGGAASPQSELSTSGALRGQEVGGSQRFEAPSPGGAYFASSEMEGRQMYEAPSSRYRQ